MGSTAEAFERELARDRALERFFNYGTLAASIAIVTIMLILIMPMGRTSPFLIALSLYSITTRLGVLVARWALRIPRFLVHLDAGDAEVAAGAREVFERHREPLARALLTRGNHHPDDAAIRSLAPELAAEIAREMDPSSRRRTGIACLAVWSVLSLAIWGTIVATGGGPTT